MTSRAARHKTRVLLASAVSLMLSVSAITASDAPSFPKRTPYDEARESLLALGYTPITAPNADQCEANDERCAGRPEMLFCSGTGLARCGFLWKSPRGALYEIGTIGELSPFVSSIKCRANCR
mgnify:CR=1 FL=1